ncbi:Uncharacterised protein [Chlamydia trachomatis]|nr:Uncharacterised protein [Chlamydia trachomatis]
MMLCTKMKVVREHLPYVDTAMHIIPSTVNEHLSSYK